MEEIVRQVGYLPDLYEEARSEKNIKFSAYPLYSRLHISVGCLIIKKCVKEKHVS